MKQNELNIQNLTPYFLAVDFNRGVLTIDLTQAKPPIVVTVSIPFVTDIDKKNMESLKTLDIDAILKMNPENISCQ